MIARPAAADPADPADDRGLARSIAVSFGGAAVSSVLGFLLTVVLSRMLGDAGSGVVLQAIAVFAIVLSLAKLGMDSVAVWMLPRVSRGEARQARGVFALLLVSALVGGVVGGIVVIVVMPVVLRHDAGVAAAVGASGWFMPAAAVLLVALAASRGLGGIGPYVAVGSVGLPLARLVTVAVVAAAGAGLTAVTVGWSAPVVPLAVVAIVVAGRMLVSRESSGAGAGPRWADRDIRRQVRAYAIPRTLTAALEQSLLWLDVVLVGLLAGSAAAGIYGGASRFVAAGLIVDTAVRVVVAPRFSSLLELGRRDELESLYRTAASWLVMFSTPIYLLLAVFAPVVLGWLGPEFGSGATALAILCGGVILSFSAGTVHTVLLMSGRSGWAAINKTIALLVNIAGNLLLVPAIGITGAAIAWSLSMSVDAGLAALQVRRFAGIGVDLRGIGYSLLVPVVTVALPAVALRLMLGATPLALGAALVVGGLLFPVWCVRDRDRLHLTDLVALTRRRPDSKKSGS